MLELLLPLAQECAHHLLEVVVERSKVLHLVHALLHLRPVNLSEPIPTARLPTAAFLSLRKSRHPFADALRRVADLLRDLFLKGGGTTLQPIAAFVKLFNGLLQLMDAVQVLDVELV